MRFFIPSKIFTRLAVIPSNFTKDVSQESKDVLSCVRLENHNGNLIAIAANQKLAAIEIIGKTTEADGHVDVAVNEQTLKFCENNPDDILEIFSMPAFSIGTMKNSSGRQFEGNPCIYPKETILDIWRDWGPEEPINKSNGCLFLNLDYIELLNKASPSGKIVFPKHIDVDQTLVLRDFDNPSWVGLFTPRPSPLCMREPTPANLPDWWNK